MDNIERKFIDLASFKMSDDGPGELSGYASEFGILDDGGDLALPGAFAATREKFLKAGFTAHSHDWSYDGVIGFPVEAKEDENGFFITSRFHSTPDAQNIRTKAKERMDAGKDVKLSIGYLPKSVDYINAADYKSELPKYVKPHALDAAMAKATRFPRVRLLKSIELFEHSIVTVPMLETAQATQVKSMDKPEEKGVSGASDLPLAARDRAWDASAADKRVRDWAEAKDVPNAKYRKAFFWYDGESSDNFTAYKLGFADVIDGKLTAIPRAIFACAGAHGVEAADVPDADKTKIKGKISAYYKRMAKEFEDDTLVAPWDKEKSFAEIEVKGIFEEELAERNNNPWSYWDVLCCILYRLAWAAEASEGVVQPADLMAKFDEAMAEFTARMRAWFATEMAPESADDDTGMAAEEIAYAGLLSLGEQKSRFSDFSEKLLGVLDVFVARAKDVASWKAARKEGRMISAANRDRMKTAVGKIDITQEHLTAVRDDIQELLDASEPKSDEAKSVPADEANRLLAGILKARFDANEALHR